MLREKAAKLIKVAATSLMLAFGVAAAAKAVPVQADMLTEVEPNNNPAAATKLPLNTWATGVCNPDSGDQDWYEFTISEAGYFAIEIEPAESNTDSTAKWSMQFIDENRNVLISTNTLAGRYGHTYEGGWVPGKYYLQIKPGTAFLEEKGGAYNVRAAFFPSDSWENEMYYGHKSLANATPTYINKEYTGSLYCSEDMDYYRIKLNGKNKVSLKFTIDNTVSDPGTWKIEFINFNTREKLNGTGEAVNTNRTLTVECTGDLLVRISNQSSWGSSGSATNQKYHILATVPSSGNNNPSAPSTLKAPSATKITSIKPAKKKATISWRKVSGATGYYVYRSTSKNGTYKKIATVKRKTTYIDKKSLKSKKYYYYKVVTYKKYGSKVAKSKMSSYKKVKIK